MDREDRRRYFVVGSVILEIVTPVFRKKIKSTYKGQGKASFKDFLNHLPILHILFHLRHKNTWCCQDRNNCVSSRALPLNYCQWDLLYSQSAGACGRLCHCKYLANPVETKDLDITLASLIILNCCNLTPNEDTLIENLRIFKNNYLSHNTKGGITLAEYNTLWADLTSYIIQLDPGKEDDLIRIEKRPLDESLCTHYVGSLVDLHKKMDEIDAKMDANNAVLMEKMDVLINRETCDCSKNKTKKKPYRLGQDIFRLHHHTDLRLVFNVNRIGYVSDGVMMDDGRLVFCLYNKEVLLICNTDGSEVDRIPLQYMPWDVTAVNNSTVAVTLPCSHCIELYDINNKHKLKSIPVPEGCMGITTINNKLVGGCWNGKLLMIDDQTGEVVQIIDTDCRIPDRLHTSGDRIFYCDSITQFRNNPNLYCYSYTDDKVTTLTLPSQPYSITSLQDGSLYAVCKDGSVQHVSSDGQHYKPVKTKGLQSYKDCQVITYNVTQRTLLTFDDTGIIKIFEHR